MTAEFFLLGLFVTAAFATLSGPDCNLCNDYGFNPVCSTEGNTYANICFLECDLAHKACDGQCPCDFPGPSDCNCGQEISYVCTTDNETYDNECKAHCDGKVKQCDDKCPCS